MAKPLSTAKPQQPDWPAFQWQTDILSPLLREVVQLQGKLLGRISAIGEETREVELNAMLQNILQSSAIEGENLNEESVRSSLPRTDNGNYIWIQLFYSALNEKGRAGFVMANSASDARASELEIRKQMKSGLDVDDQDVLDVVRTQVNELIEEAIETVKIDSNLPDPVNIAGIDFDALAEMLNRTKKPKRSDIERLRRIIEHRLSQMLEKNASRLDLQQKFQELVEQYNLGAYQAEQFFKQLRDFIVQLDEEEKRAAREGLSEAELAIVDLLCKGVELSENERNKVKAIAKELLKNLQEALVIDWRKKQRTKARVQKIIDDVFQELPDTYNDDLWPKACEHVFLHIFDKYAGEGRSVYMA